MYPRIKSVEVKDDYILWVTFDNGVVKEYDCKPKLNDERFSVLKDKLIFGMVKVDPGGYGISWNDDIDISEYEIWTNAKQVSGSFQGHLNNHRAGHETNVTKGWIIANLTMEEKKALDAEGGSAGGEKVKP